MDVNDPSGIAPVIASIDESAAAGDADAAPVGPVSLGQESVLIAQEVAMMRGSKTPSRYYALCFAVSEPVDRKALVTAWEAVVSRHSSLRTFFVRAPGYPPDLRRRHLHVYSQTATFIPGLFEARVAARPRIELEIHRLECEPHLPELDAVTDVAAAAAAGETELEEHPGRALLLLATSGRTYFVVTVSHLAADAWSARLIEREFVTLYTSLRSGRTAALPAAPAFATFADQEREWVFHGDTSDYIGYWAQEWRAASDWRLKRADLPIPEPQTVIDRKTRNTCVVLSTAESAAVSRYLHSRAPAMSAHALFRAAFMMALCAGAGRERVACWANFANRTQRGIRAVVGAVSTRHLLGFHVDRVSCDAACREMARKLSESQRYQALPFAGLLIQRGAIYRPSDASVTFDTSWQPNDTAPCADVVRPMLLRGAVGWMDLDVRILGRRDTFRLSATYNARRYEADATHALLQATKAVAVRCADEPSADMRYCLDLAAAEFGRRATPPPR